MALAPAPQTALQTDLPALAYHPASLAALLQQRAGLRAPAAGLWRGPACTTALVCAFCVYGFAWTLRPHRLNAALTPGWLAAHALLAACCAVAVVSLWVTHLVDPGYLVPSATPDPQFVAVASGAQSGAALGWSCDSFGQWSKACGARYCTTCHLWRPPRAAHCGTCNFCVERHDHHCGVVAACVGARNHAWFTTFLVSAAAGALVLLVGASVQLNRLRWPWTTDSWQNWRTYLHLVSLLLYISVTGLTGFAATHVVLIFSNRTTRSFVSRRRDSAGAMQGCCTGLQEVCCVPMRTRHGVERAWQAALEEAQQHKAQGQEGGS